MFIPQQWNPTTQQSWDSRVVDAYGTAAKPAASVGFPAAAAHEQHDDKQDGQNPGDQTHCGWIHT
jgi:hypothetical protein